MQSDIASWFDSAMNQVSGDYKRYAQLWTFLIGLALAAVFNIDAIAIVHALLTQPALAGSIQVTAADVSQTPDLAAIKAYGLPIGWTSPQTTIGAFLGSGVGRSAEPALARVQSCCRLGHHGHCLAVRRALLVRHAAALRPAARHGR
ncbi:MAG: hypothetical protein WDN69_10775 [Aliidongia sp.]